MGPFVGRPDLPQLALDLVEVRGGGMMPSQFEGRTPDGRPVYIRYRGGTLGVYCGAPGERETGLSSTLLLEARIGQPLHGEILFAQISEITGITLRGQHLALSEEEFLARQLSGSHLQDFSGRRIYWERSALVSSQGGDDFIRSFCQRLPGTRLVSWHFRPEGRPVLLDRADASEFPDDWRFYFVHGPDAHGDLDETLPRIGKPGLTLIDCNAEWKDRIMRRARQSAPARVGERFGPWREDAQRRHSNPVWRLNCRSCFLAGDQAAAAYFARVEDLFAAIFADSGEIFDPATTRAIRKDKAPLPYSRDLIQWCAEDPNNSICAIRREDDEARPFWGFRATTD